MTENTAYPAARIAVFSKAPEAGKVKTRLIPELGEQAATDLHFQLLQQTLDRVCRSDLCDAELWCSPQINHPVFNRLSKRYGIKLCLQQGNSLGERMAHASKLVLERAQQLVIIGTDCPAMQKDYIEASLQLLTSGNDIVIGPAEDGGYVLIAMAKPVAGIFSAIDWGTDRVLEQTLERIRQHKLAYSMLNTLWDVDRIEDYHRYLAM